MRQDSRLFKGFHFTEAWKKAEAYLGLSRISMMECFAKIVNGVYPLTTFAKKRSVKRSTGF